MSGSNRSERPEAIALFVFLLGLTVILSYQFGRDSGLLETEPHEHSNAYADRADEQIQSICFSENTIELAVKCATQQKNQTDYANQEHRANHDLTSQRAMARYAWWMVVVTFATFLTAIGGIYYLRVTLFETRRIGQAQTRAYVTVFPKRECNLISGKYEFRLCIKNGGNSPARNVKYKALIEAKNGVRDVGAFDLSNTANKFDRIIAANQGFSEILKLESEFREDMINDWKIYIVGTLSYIDIFNDFHETKFAFYLDSVIGKHASCLKNVNMKPKPDKDRIMLVPNRITWGETQQDTICEWEFAEFHNHMT